MVATSPPRRVKLDVTAPPAALQSGMPQLSRKVSPLRDLLHGVNRHAGGWCVRRSRRDRGDKTRCLGATLIIRFGTHSPFRYLALPPSSALAMFCDGELGEPN